MDGSRGRGDTPTKDNVMQSTHIIGEPHCHVFMIVGRPEWWDDAVAHLSTDPLLSETVDLYRDEGISGHGEIFHTLVRSIVGQQISVKAADSVFNRLEEFCGEISRISVGSCTVDEIASCGMSKQKSLYIHGIATSQTPLLPEGYEKMEDRAIINHLMQFKGVGPWTAEMILIFSLMRPDVLSLGDLGVVKGIQLLVPLAQTKVEMELVAEAWRPFRSAACWFLWRRLDPVPVEY